MATMDFPASPSSGDIHTHSGKRWQWDGAVWRAYSLAFTGTPVAPTAAAGTDTTQIATTAYVQTELEVIPGIGNTLTFEGSSADDFETTLTVVDPTADRTVTLQNADGTVALTSDLATYALLADPTFTGTPDAPTAAADTNTTQIATTAYVQTELGAISSDSLSDADSDTKIQVEEGSDDDTIRFDVAGTQVATMAADVTTLEGNNNRTVQVKNTGGAYAYLTFQDTNTTAPSAGGGVTGANRVGCQTNDLLFYADGEEKGRFIAGGGLTFNGDTAAANALDDYEEGTFTVAFTAGSGTITAHTSGDTCSYVKIGQIVHIQGYIYLSAVSSPSGTLYMTGLPFTTANTAEASGYATNGSMLRETASNIPGNLYGRMSPNDNKMFFQAGGGQTTLDQTLAGYVDAGTSFWIGATYRASA